MHTAEPDHSFFHEAKITIGKIKTYILSGIGQNLVN
jgi:hypothetical protein